MVKKPKILIAEDEETLLTGLAMTFSLKGDLEIFTAMNGKDAVDIALKEHPDYIVIDLIMPILDGPGAIEKLRQDEWGKKSKIAVWSNSIDPVTLKKVKDQLHVDAHWVKSDFSFKDIVNMVREKISLPMLK